MGKARPQRRAAGTVSLLAEILEGSADLRGARCVEYPNEFDKTLTAEEIGYADEGERWEMCNVVCRACPARGACWEWAQTLPDHWRAGMGPIADSTINPFSMKRTKAAAAAALRDHTASATQIPPEPEIPPPRPTQRRGARSRVRPSVHRFC